MKRTIIEQPVAPAPGRANGAPPAVARPALEPVRSRRRPLLVGLGVALTALGGLGAVWLASTGTGTVTVVGIAKEVRAGDVIQKGDLVGVQVVPGTALRTLSVDHYADVVGKRSLVRLLRGRCSTGHSRATTCIDVPQVGAGLGERLPALVGVCQRQRSSCAPDVPRASPLLVGALVVYLRRSVISMPSATALLPGGLLAPAGMSLLVVSYQAPVFIVLVRTVCGLLVPTATARSSSSS